MYGGTRRRESSIIPCICNKLLGTIFYCHKPITELSKIYHDDANINGQDKGGLTFETNIERLGAVHISPQVKVSAQKSYICHGGQH